MKKILFASTALVATAGIASADVKLTGWAEMGVYNPGGEAETQFFDDIDVTFTMTGEADNGLVFGANVDLDESNTFAFETPSQQGGEAMFVSYGGLTLTMGDTDGALDARVPEMGLAGGSIADDETAHLGFNHMDGVSGLEGDLESTIGLSLDGFGDGQIARVDYSISSFTISASAEQIDDGQNVEDIGDTIWGLGVSWTGEVAAINLGAGLGYQTVADAASVTSVAVTGGFANGLSLGATYSLLDIDGADDDVTHVGVGFGYEMNALALGVNWGQYEMGDDELSGWGLAVAYDLGGGLQAQFGYGWSDADYVDADDVHITEDDNTWSLGLKMSF